MTARISYLRIGQTDASVSSTDLRVPQTVCVSVGPLLLWMTAAEADELGRALFSHGHLSRVAAMQTASAVAAAAECVG